MQLHLGFPLSESAWWYLGLTALGSCAVARGVARFILPRQKKARRCVWISLWALGFAAIVVFQPNVRETSAIWPILPWNYGFLMKEYPTGLLLALASTFICGIPICLILSNHISALEEGLSQMRGLQAIAAMVCFSATGIFYLGIAAGPAYGLPVPLQDETMPYIGFILCAVAASLEAGCAYHARRNSRTPAPDLAAACLFVVASYMDNIGVAALMLPLLFLRLFRVVASNLSKPADRPDVSDDEIRSDISILRRRLASIDHDPDDHSRMFWLLPPDRLVISRMIGEGRLHLPEISMRP